MNNDPEELKTENDYINLLNEINAYRELDGQDFDFGSGTITNEMSYGSEDAYYEMDIQSLEDTIEHWDYDRPVKPKPYKNRENKYYRNRKYKDKLWKMTELNWMPIWKKERRYEEGLYPKRYYRSKISSYLKKQSNKKIRRYKGGFPSKGNCCHKVYDYWWKLY